VKPSGPTPGDARCRGADAAEDVVAGLRG
jgi:hypothetical protein